LQVSGSEQNVEDAGGRKVEVLLVGMNPGPFGMAQTGLTFGDSVFVRNFLHVTGKVQSPESMHPKRPILGLTCPRREASGQRLWGWVQARFGSAAPFFERFWVHNYCPLLVVEASGKNCTPDKLTTIEKDSVIGACNMALRAIMALLQPRLVVGVGATLSFELLFELFYDLMNHASSIISFTGLKI
jgi:single-strand selective monofunctional uracil DNA glycosylase